MEKTKKIVKKQISKKSGIPVFNLKGKVVSEVVLPVWLKKVNPNMNLIAQYVRIYQMNQRQGTVSTKARSEVKGSTRKIYRQKGTGRARHGSIKAPIFVGGGIVGGPRPKKYELSLSKKQKKRVFIYALSLAVNNKLIKLVESNSINKISPKTKEADKFLKNMGYGKDKILLVLENMTDNFKRAFRNLPRVKYREMKSLNAYDLISFQSILMTNKALEFILSLAKSRNENK